MQKSLITRILPFIPKLLDKLVERYIRKKMDEISGKDKQLEALKEILVKEVQEKHLWRNEFEKLKIEGERMTESLIKIVVGWTFERIEKDFILVPKDYQERARRGLGERKFIE